MLMHSMFESGKGCTEHFFSLYSEPGTDFTAEAQSLLTEYERAIAEFGCSEQTEFLLRFHLSDITNQAPLLRQQLGKRNSFLSLLGQPPAFGSRLALESWHMNPLRKTQLGEHTFRFDLKHYQLLLSEGGKPTVTGSFDQTKEEFIALEEHLKHCGGTMKDHTIRTWLYCRDVDNNYAGLVRARNEYFDRIGLTPDTHFLASTGIEGQSEEPSRLVTMDSLSIPGIRPEQIRYLSAPEMLSPTALYGVRFERGTRVIFGDRSHYFISGTASIDKEGKVLYVNDVRAQTERLLDNVEALMQSAEGKLSDLKQATLYLRDPADAKTAQEILNRRFSNLIPVISVRAPVCRPTWIVEMEAIGINGFTNNYHLPFC